MTKFFSRLGVSFAVVVLGLGLFSSPAWAHNSFQSSNPADGAVLTSAPARLSLIFASAVPLDTASVDLIDSSSTKVSIGALAHGSAGATEIVATLPKLNPGAYTFRWRLVGADGHAVTGRVGVVIQPSAVATAAPTAAPISAPTTARLPAASVTTLAAPSITAAATARPPGAAPQQTIPPETASATQSSTSVASTAASAGTFQEPWTMPSPVRWLLRIVSYLGMFVVAGTIATMLLVWPAAWDSEPLQRLVRHSLIGVAVAALLQLLVTASDIAGKPLWSSFGGLGGAFHTDAGKALVVRILAVAGTGWSLYLFRPSGDRVRWQVSAGLATLALTTWAFTGHSRSMRWPLVGVPLDVAHFGAAAAWFGGLGIIGWFIVETDPDERKLVMQRFGQLAAACVTILVVTGVLQSFRLVGAPWRVFAVTHGRLLLLKVLLVGLMLKVADVNRVRVARRFGHRSKTPSAKLTDNLRRAMFTELAIGTVIMAITAAMVVSPPAIAGTEGSSPAKNPAAATTTSLAAALPTSAATTVAVTTTTVAPASVAACRVQQALSSGSSGEAVTCLQRALIVQGLLKQPPTGQFDGPTTTAVRAYQAANKLFVDGIAGKTTATSLGIWGA